MCIILKGPVARFQIHVNKALKGAEGLAGEGLRSLRNESEVRGKTEKNPEGPETVLPGSWKARLQKHSQEESPTHAVFP